MTFGEKLYQLRTQKGMGPHYDTGTEAELGCGGEAAEKRCVCCLLYLFFASVAATNSRKLGIVPVSAVHGAVCSKKLETAALCLWSAR